MRDGRWLPLPVEWRGDGIVQGWTMRDAWVMRELLAGYCSGLEWIDSRGDATYDAIDVTVATGTHSEEETKLILTHWALETM